MKRQTLLYLFAVLVFLVPAEAAAQQGGGEHPYQNPALPTEERVADLVSRMTLEEKVSQMNDQAPAVERLGIPAYNWWNEALHGVARSGLATVFPQAIGLAATWNDSLIYRMATVISDEARAKHHRYVRRGKRLRYQGLTMFSPNINLVRDPRWGRGQETYGEDPHLTSELAIPFVKGLQGDDPEYLKTVATVKHLALYSGPEPLRHAFDATTDERDFRETYLPQFRRTIAEGNAYSVMCAYNRVFGIPACSSEPLLEDLLREEWPFEGYVVSDCWAINDIYENHQVVETPVQAAAQALQAGTDLDCGSEVYPELTEAVRRGLVEEAAVDTAVSRLMRARFRLGMFDPPEQVGYAQIPYDVVDQPSHRRLARSVARESMVLLKNEDETLPLRKDLDTIAVIGPNADQWLMLLGNYNGVPGTLTTPLEGIRAAVSPQTEVLYAQGSEIADGFPVFDVVPGAFFSTPEGKPGLAVEYFDDRAMSNAPIATGTDAALDANWHGGAPQHAASGTLDADDFAARWTGTFTPEQSGTYELGVIATSKFQLYLGDSLLARSRYNYMDELGDPRLVKAEPMHLEAGTSYDLRLVAQEGYGNAQVQLVWAPPRGDLLREAVAAAEQADAVVLAMGLTPAIEGEEMDVDIRGFRGGDRTRLDLPAAQQRLIRRVAATGTPTVLTLLNGSALAVNEADATVPALLEAWYPGQAAGTAMADVLFGDYNPAGRLPITFYESTDQLPPFEDYDMEGRTYRFFEGTPLYPFGHGLSYTTFAYSRLRTVTATLAAGDTTIVHVDVANTGARAGDEVVQLYAQHEHSGVERPRKELKGFARIHLAPGETRTVALPLAARDLAYWHPGRDEWVVEEATVRLQVGRSSEDIRQTTTIGVTQ